MCKHQRQQICFVYEFLAETGLQLGRCEQELLTAWLIWHSACAILLSASPLGPSVAATHITMSVKAVAAVLVFALDKKADSEIRKKKEQMRLFLAFQQWGQEIHCTYRPPPHPRLSALGDHPLPVRQWQLLCSARPSQVWPEQASGQQEQRARRATCCPDGRVRA
jgi:hypothetical protein